MQQTGHFRIFYYYTIIFYIFFVLFFVLFCSVLFLSEKKCQNAVGSRTSQFAFQASTSRQSLPVSQNYSTFIFEPCSCSHKKTTQACFGAKDDQLDIWEFLIKSIDRKTEIKVNIHYNVFNVSARDKRVMSSFAFLASLNSRISFGAVVEHSVHSEVSIWRFPMFSAGLRLFFSTAKVNSFTKVLRRKDYPHHYFFYKENVSLASAQFSPTIIYSNRVVESSILKDDVV